MKKSPSRSVFLDKLHKGFVWACIGVTFYAGSEIGWHYYQFFTKVKPEREKMKLLEQQSLLAEGHSPDTAPTLTS